MNAVEVNKEIEQQYWLLEALPVAALISRREDGQVLYANERFGALAGKPPAELVGHVTPDFYYDPAERTALLATLQERGLVQDYEMRGRRLSDGSPVWLSLVVQAVTYQGEAAYLTTLMDITEHKQAEIALAQSESQYRVLAENIQDGVFIIQNAKMIFANQAFADIVGYTVEEIIGMEFTRLIAPEDLPKVAESYRRRQAGEPVPPAYEWRMLRKDGVTRVDVNMTVGLVQLGGQVASLGTVKDITERKRAEAERERYTRQLSVAAEIAARVQSILDPDELLQAVIPLIKERFGLYYVHVYTLEGETLELRAGYGEPGRIMVAQGHRIPLLAEQSLVARAARTQVPVLVNDVTAEPDFLPNPLLPQTKSEVAVPAIAGGKVLGVFDVQHDTPGYFTEADLDVFRTLAGQIAVALENAQLFEAQRQAEATVRESQRRLTTLMGNLVGMVYRMLNRPDWPAEFVSEGSLALTGYAPEALMLGGEISFGDLIYPEDQNAVWETVQAALQAHQPYQATYRIVHRDGTIRWVWEQGRGIEDEEGNVVALEGLITDITDRVQAEAALHENEQRFRALIENSSDLITIVSPEGLIAYQSPSLKRILGYEPEELIGRSVVEFIPPETVPGIAALLAGIGQQPGAVVHAEYIFRHKDGSWRTMEGSAQASTVAGIAGIVVNSRDVTERKAAEQALRESEEKFRVLADNIAVGIFVHQDGIIKYLGHEAARLLGYSDPAEVAGRSILDLIHPDERERVGTIARQRVAGEAVPDTYESRLLRKDGTAMDVMMYSSIISYEGRPATQGAFLDITERKQAEKAMQLDDIRQRALLRLSQMAEAPLKEILDYAIEEFGHITDSPISYLAFVNADESVMTMHAWSGGAMAQCKIIDKPIVYPVVTTGLWGEAIRQRRAIITNDYDEPNPWKRGYPQGHVEVKRHMNAPIFDGEHIVMVVGVGNKPEDYTDSDVQQLTLLATGLWQVIQRKQADEERERYTQRLSVAAEIAARVQSILDPDELLQAVIPLIKERFGLYYVHVYTLEGEALKLRAGYGEPGRIMLERGHSIPLEAEKSLVARAARTQEVVVVEDVTAAPDFLPNPLLPETRSEVAVPAIAGGQVIGVFDVQHDVPGYFTEADLDVFRALAGQIATAFQNAQLYTEAQLRLRISQALAGAQTEAAVLDTLAEQATIFPAARVTLHLIDATAEELTTVLVRAAGAESGLSAVIPLGTRFTAKQLPLLRAVGRDRSFVIADATTDPHLDEATRQLLVQQGSASLALLPITAGEEWLGVLSLAAAIPGYFDEAKLALYRALVEEGAVALQAAQLRERAAEAASRFQELVNSALVGIFRTTPAGQVVAANPAMLRILGFDSVAAINKVGLSNLYVDPQERQRLLETLAQGPVTDFEVLFRRADGSVITIALSGRLVYDAAGQPEYLDGTFEDVTERKRAEQALREAEARQRQVLGTVPVSLVVSRVADGTILYANEQFSVMFGKSAADMLGQTTVDLYYDPAERQQVVSTVQTEGRLSHYELRLKRLDDGRMFWSDLSIDPFELEGEPVLLSAFFDITERKQAEAERERFAQRLSVAAEIAARVQSILDPDELLQAVIPLIKERFGLYYVHVYTLEGEALKLRAGYGEPGRIMVERGHSIPLEAEKSLVARAARTQEIVVVEDVTAAPDFLPNPLLPETRSEVAVPAIAGGKVVGVFDVQHDVPGYFTEADLDVFRALAGQIATAFQNASLYVATEASAARNRALLQTVPDMMFVFDAAGIFQDFKAEAGQELLVPPELFLGKPLGTVLPPQIAEPTLKYLKQVLATGEPVTYEYEAPLGETMHSYEARMSRVGTDQALALVRDITERKQAEERIQRSELLLRTVFNSVYDGIFLHTAEGAIVDVNDKILEMYGVSREEATRLSIADDYSSPDNPLDQLGVLWQRVMAGQPQLFEWKAKRPHDGTTFDAEVFLRRVTLGGRDMVLANVRDITERKQAEAAVAGERDFSNALINSLPVIFYLYDQAGSLVRWNRRYEEVLGYTPAEMPQVKVLDTIAELDRALIVARMNEVFTTGYAEAEAHLLSKTGRPVPYLVTGTRLAVGDQVYLVGAGIDLTERKRAEAQRERFVTQLSTAAEISAQVGAILDTDELLDEVIPLLKERFNLYHVHFYVMDEARQELVLRAGYGQVGRIMRQQGFKITLDQEQSLVARAARTRQIALANDVTQDPDFMPNLLLPDTRAEVAVPAMIGDRLLGVFDVQSDQADYFTESDLDVYRTLAGQIANAFQSARLFEQQRQAEAAQREAAEKIRAMFDAMTEGITVTNMMGKIEDLNEATLRLYGYSGRDDLLGRSSMQLFTRPFWSKAAESVRRALETGTSQTAEYRMVRRDGSEFEAEMNAALLRDATGAPSGFVSIIRDITARKRAEEERARLTAQLRTAADISTQVASILDPQALFSRVVSLIKERFDIYHVQVYVVDEETQELVLQAGYGEPGRVMVARGHRIPLNTERSLVARAARTKEVVVVDDVTKSPDHLPNPLLPLTRSEVAVPAVYGDRVLGVFDVQDDEPARFGPAELDVFRTLAGQIATAFQNAGYVEELQHVAERFRELDRLKSEFLANMSHELRTPLNSIIGYAEVLLMGIDGELEGDTLEDVKAIHENGQHLLSMINDVLDLAKIEAGRMVLKMEEVEVDQLLDEVKSSGTGLLRKYQRTEAVELRIASEPDLPLLHADRIRLNQVLNNLISNAMKFTEHGYVQVRAYRSDPWVCIEVADSGIGIPANQLEQIFEKFRQVDGSSKRRAEGTGLGLAITRYLVEMHGGTIEVSSELGKGSVFTVRLPIQTAPADPEGGAG